MCSLNSKHVWSLITKQVCVNIAPLVVFKNV